MRQFNCGSCSVYNGNFTTMCLPVRYAVAKQFLATEVAPRGEILYTEVLNTLWKNKKMTTELFGKKVNKYNINNFLLQLVATGVACLELPKKTERKVERINWRRELNLMIVYSWFQLFMITYQNMCIIKTFGECTSFDCKMKSLKVLKFMVCEYWMQ